MTELAAAALAYAAAGLPVFPMWPPVPLPAGGYGCGCGRLSCTDVAKHPIGPLCRHGAADASCDPTRVKWFWLSRPDANVAIATGAAVLVLDIDPRHEGDKALAALLAQHGELPPTWRAITGGNGEHFYFRPPDGETIRNSAGKLGAGLDIRGLGGAAVAPPSLHQSGRRYAWQPGHDPDHVPLAPVPQWLLALLRQPRATSAIATEWRDIVRDDIAEGTRNETITKLAGHLLRRYVDPVVTLELMLAWNATHCRPPLDPAEIKRTVASIARRELARRETRGR